MSTEAPSEGEARNPDPPTTEQHAEQAASVVILLDQITGQGTGFNPSGRSATPIPSSQPEPSTASADDGNSNVLSVMAHGAESEDVGFAANNIVSPLGQGTHENIQNGASYDTTAQSMANQTVGTGQSLGQQHAPMLNQLAEVGQRTDDEEGEARAVDEASSSTDVIQPRTDSRQALTIDSDSENDERLNQYLATQQRTQTIGDILRREESRHRYRVLANAREIATASNTFSGSNPTPTQATLDDTTRLVNHSITARRDLERALRDYRLARRVLRTHYTSESNSSADQNNPTYQGVLAQLAEQQNNNRNRMRARGQSRSNTLERTDAIAARLVAAGGISNDAWRSDEDNDTTAGSSISPTSLSEITPARPRYIGRIVMPVASNIAPEPYLGPTSSAGNSTASAGGMRDFYRRVEDQDHVRERNARRMGPPTLRPRLPLPELQVLADSTTLPTTTAQRDHRSNREQRIQDTLGRLTTALSPVQGKIGLPTSELVKSRAKNVLKYLSGLKTTNNDGDQALALAKDLGIDSLAESLARETDFDLPLRINELPHAQYSSWLSSGMSWKGVQKSGVGRAEPGVGSGFDGFASGPLFEPGSIENRIFHLRAWRHRERVRAERRSLAPRDSDSSSQIPAGAPEEDRRILSRLGSAGADTLADVERHLSDLLEEEERRLNRARDNGWRVNSVSFRPRSSTSATTSVPDRDESMDQWPVQVILHEVNWEKMTVSGTMVASQIGGHARSAVSARNQASAGPNEGEDEDKDEDKEELSADMQTFFDGEIIDFRTHELETVADKPGYKVGGPLTDLKYWSQIGPFKAELAKRIPIAKDDHAREVYGRLGISGTLDEQRAEYQRTFGDDRDSVEKLDKEELNDVAYDVMVECIGSRKWLEKACGDGGWVFMRWKERCFITPPSSRPSSSSGAGVNSEHSRLRTIIQRPTSTNAYTTTYSDDRHHDRSGTWGLTIQGFYYVALHRMSGRIEALYFDSGSRPYQELTCQPADSISSDNNNEGSECIFKGLGDIGIRKNFGVYEFR